MIYKLSKKSSFAIKAGLDDKTLSTNISALIDSYTSEVQTGIKYEHKKFELNTTLYNTELAAFNYDSSKVAQYEGVNLTVQTIENRPANEY